MKFLENLSKKIGFTRTETNVIIFIIFSCLIGIVVNIIKNYKNDQAYLEFDYKKEDSLFLSASNDDLTADSNITLQEKKIASKHELLDFTKEKSKRNNLERITNEQKIRINSASISEILTLPGLGQKTANAILEYRKLNGRIKSVDDLLTIKGIGKAKLNKIKKLISFD